MVTVISICLVALLAAEGSCHLAEVRKLSGLEYSQEHVLPLEAPQNSILPDARRTHRPLFSWEDVGGNDTSAPVSSSSTVHKQIKHQSSHRADKTSTRKGKNRKGRGRRKDWTLQTVKQQTVSEHEVGKRGKRKHLLKIEKENRQLKERLRTDLNKRRKFKIKEKTDKSSSAEGDRKERIKKRRQKNVTKPKKRNKKKQRNETAEGPFQKVSDGKLSAPSKSEHHAKNFTDGLTTFAPKQLNETVEDGARSHKGSNLLGNELPAPSVKEEKIGESFKTVNDNTLFPFHFPSPERTLIASETSTNHSRRHKGNGADGRPTAQNKEDVVTSFTSPSHETVTEQTTTASDGDVTNSTPATAVTESTDGDLSCLKNTFLPAPEVGNAVVKYTRTSSYLIAEYECDVGYHLEYSGNYSMICSNREWIGSIPKCISDRAEVANRVPCHKGQNTCDQVCEVIAGNVTCSCYKGFRLHGNSCKDIDECEFANGGCERECRNTMGAFMCLCPPGLRLADDNRHCTDVNECLLRNGHGPCQDHCRNEWGGYACSCEGIPGTKLSADNHTCEDVDECADGSAGCSHSCLNTLGSAFCLCPAGFMLGSDWKTCQDIDECEYEDLQTEHCELGCVNTIGSYHCLEPQDEGRSDPVVNCLPGFRPGHENSCVDIDECLEDKAGCSHRCINTLGSFFCMCHRGFALAPDKKTCIDDSVRDVCPPLGTPPHGYLKCARHPIRAKRRTRFINHAGTVCDLQCPQGYRKEGEYRKVCGLNHRWEGPDDGSCVRIPNHFLYRVK